MTTPRKTVAVLGASGFVGSHTCYALESRGHTVVRIRAPRLAPMTASDAATFPDRAGQALDDLASSLQHVDALVNAAGVAEARSGNWPALVSANSALPALAARAAAVAGLTRFVQVSSAAVQGRLRRLDEGSQFDAFSPYARSKLLGEHLVRQEGPAQTVIYRPPGVHGADRRVTRLTARIARSAVSTVAAPGTDPTPQTLIDNVADALAYLATTASVPASIVMHPSELLTTTTLLEALGGKRPIRIPRRIARTVVRGLNSASRLSPSLAGNARRVEMLWFGQEQAHSWLTAAGWLPPVGHEGWRALGRKLAQLDTGKELKETGSQ
ncbi:NAD-dependent epimerase/dehydratase family protein [Georgenia faecalis]|uniref:NAD-dependent epimerase/dehydratase family protein n=1 Tax=Georgenia faecalis TaxID=2483799 RepID=A0ABV9D5L4_9MICO|nr:NAD-dependent epimerase/dehydratase family protein [Georgenia faecalis]